MNNETMESLGLTRDKQVSNIDQRMLQDPNVVWYKEAQESLGKPGIVTPAEPFSDAGYASAIVAVLPDGHWTYFAQNWDTSD